MKHRRSIRRPVAGRVSTMRAGRGFARFAVLAACALLLAGVSARAAGTSPVLALTSALVVPASGGERLLTAEGAFNFDDLLQIAFPAAGLMVVRGDRFVRYEVDGSVVEATSAAVQNGVTAAELPALLQLTGTAVSPARLVRVAASDVAVVLPADLGAGAALVLLYAQHDAEHFVSNAIPVVLP